jgi:hypothetical protein
MTGDAHSKPTYRAAGQRESDHRGREISPEAQYRSGTLRHDGQGTGMRPSASDSLPQRSAVARGQGQPVGVAPAEIVVAGLIGDDRVTGLPEVTVGVLAG